MTVEVSAPDFGRLSSTAPWPQSLHFVTHRSRFTPAIFGLRNLSSRASSSFLSALASHNSRYLACLHVATSFHCDQNRESLWTAKLLFNLANADPIRRSFSPNGRDPNSSGILQKQLCGTVCLICYNIVMPNNIPCSVRSAVSSRL